MKRGGILKRIKIRSNLSNRDVERFTSDIFEKGDKLLYRTSSCKRIMKVIDIIGPNYNAIFLIICEFMYEYDGDIDINKYMAKKIE